MSLTFGVMCSCNDEKDLADTEDVNTPIVLTSQQMSMATTSAEFSNRFFAAYDDKNRSVNYVISPLSLQFALSMLANGADGDTHNQILTTLGYNDSELAELNEFCNKLLTDVPNVSQKSRISIFNNMWYNSDYISYINDSFATDLSKYFYASCLPSTSDNVVNLVNDWVNDKTQGRIKKALENIDKDYQCVLANVLNFDGYWPDKLETGSEKFHNENGTDVNLDFLSVKHDIITHNTEMGYIFDIPYSKASFYFRIIFPKENVVLSDFIANLSEQYAKADHWESVTCEVSFPKFHLSSRQELKDVLIGMGITNIFDKEKSNMSRMSSIPSYIQELIQVGDITVDEYGTVASIITSEYPQTSASAPSFIKEIINRPFAFEIIEASTGTVMIQGRINNL